MKNKKGLIILSSVIVVCAVALVISPIINWPIDTRSTSGNIAKSSRFSRKTATESISNMEELIKSDPSYKNGIVTAYMVMQTRAQEFSTLVDMSNEVAGDIPEFADVLDDMNKVYVTVNNVCASLVRAGENLNATLNGEQRPELAQNTINASLAYATLQKQNKLATRFIDVTDNYLQKNEGSDRLKFVRDQWVDYQILTAALDGDEKSAEALEQKGNLLSAEKCVAALGSFPVSNQVIIISHANLCNTLDVDNSVVKAVPDGVVNGVLAAVGAATNEVVNNVGGVDNLSASQEIEVVDIFGQKFVGDLANNIQDQDFIQAVGWDNIANQIVANQAATNEVIGHAANANGIISNQSVTNDVIANQNVASGVISRSMIANQTQDVVNVLKAIGSFSNIVSSYGEISTVIKASAVNDMDLSNSICNQVNNVISETAVGNKATVRIFY